MMRFDSLDSWLNWQGSYNSIELGLGRVADVARRLGIKQIATTTIIVAGTNGKGSTVAGYEAWLHSAGFRVASYTSPHLLRYNERIKFDLQMVSDRQLCEAFEAIDQARGEISLTYFEFGTLAALWLIQCQQPDYAILEVGLGGRLDAVNIIDADLVHLTSIGIDHTAWLGDNRESIGFEKAGVLREAIPVICNDSEPPQSVLNEILRLNCRLYQYQRDFLMVPLIQGYQWQGPDGLLLPLSPVLPGTHQLQNLAGVVAGLHQLLDLRKFSAEVIQKNFAATRLPGRFQIVETHSAATIYADVGHNQDAARVLATNLRNIKNPSGRVVVLLGMLDDKDCAAFVAEFGDVVDDWWLLTLNSERGLSAEQLALRLQLEAGRHFETVGEALNLAVSSLGRQDIMLITGSFVTVESFFLALSQEN